MAKASTPALNDTIQSIDDAPTVQQTARVFEAAAQRLAALDVRLKRYTALVDPHVYNAGPPGSEDEVLTAHEGIAAQRVEHARATRELRSAESAHRVAQEAERQRFRGVFRARKGDLVRRLANALLQAATVSRELAAIEDRERNLTGCWEMTGFAWSELAAPTALQGSKIDDWFRAAGQDGMLE